MGRRYELGVGGRLVQYRTGVVVAVDRRTVVFRDDTATADTSIALADIVAARPR